MNGEGLWPGGIGNPFEPASGTVTPRNRVYPDAGCGRFLGRWGVYDVRTYDHDRPGILLVSPDGYPTGYFPLAGIVPREEGRAYVDGALAVAKAMGLWPEKFAAGPYGPQYDPTTGERLTPEGSMKGDPS